ncbi:MAG TPA: hypothetical protein VGB92_18520 [Longimicrobium sp.]
MSASGSTTPPWLQALLPRAERTGYRVPLKTHVHMPGRVVADVAGVFLRLPRWQGAPFVDDLGRRPPPWSSWTGST